MRDYDPLDWHWQIGDDDSRYWSSAQGGYVEALPDDAGLTRIDSGDSLSGVLAGYGLPGPVAAPIYYPLRRWQFAAMVDVLGVAQAIEDAIASIPDPLARAVALARYRESDLYRRDDPFFDHLAPLVGLTGAQIDAAWMQIARPAGSQS